ncbi:MAG: putative two-component response regulator [Ilumatobacteraceae bacterium]|nr:putative two-component response regulator [Ilumatobacteraceae bacterium]
MHVLIATDAQWVVDELVAALGGPETSFTVCRNGRDVTGVVKARTPDLAIVDLQSGSMGGMAVTMNLRLDESSGALPYIPVLMLLDRTSDVFLAKRSGADGWLIKPLDALKIQRAVSAILDDEPVDAATPAGDTTVDADADIAVVDEDQALSSS